MVIGDRDRSADERGGAEGAWKGERFNRMIENRIMGRERENFSTESLSTE